MFKQHLLPSRFRGVLRSLNITTIKSPHDGSMLRSFSGKTSKNLTVTNSIARILYNPKYGRMQIISKKGTWYEYYPFRKI